MIFQTKSVGIDIRPDSLKMAVATLQGGRMKILNLIEREFPEAPEQETKAVAAETIRQAFRENGLDGSTCVICLPASKSINRVVSMPLTDPAKIRQTLRFQIEPQIPYPIDKVISDYVTIRKLDDGTEILAIAVAKEPIAERLQVLETTGVDPQILTLDALALADFYINPFDFSSDKITALLIANSESSFLGFFIGERLIGYRNLDGMPPDDENATAKMIKELRRSLVAFESSASESNEIGALCVAGPSAKTLWGVLQESFREIPVRNVEFNERMLVEIPPAFSEVAEEYELAIALAHAGLEAPANEVNFRREEYAPAPVLSRLKPNIMFSLAVLALMVVAWFGNVQAQIFSKSHEKKILNEEVMKIFADTLPGVKSPTVAKEKIKQEQEKFESLKNYSSEYVSPLEILAEVAKSKPGENTFALSDLAISDGSLRLTGVVDSFADIGVFEKQIEDSPLLSDVKQIGRAKKVEEGINFRISAHIGMEPRPAVAPGAETDP